jgi:hypothetical protein
MAFCEECGTQVSETAKFCSSCGRPIGTVATPLAASPVKKSSRLLRTFLVIAAAVLVLGCVGTGTAYYLFHRVTAKAATSAQDAADLNTMIKTMPGTDTQTTAPAAPPAAGESAPALDPNKIVTPEDGQCALFTKEELSKVLDTTLTHADEDATGCTYKGDAPRLWLRTEATWTGGKKLVKAKSDTYKSLRQSMIAQHYSKADIDSHIFPMMPYPGVGDEAWVNLWNVVTARKGDRGITMDLRFYHDSDDLTKLLTNTALSRLQDKRPDSVAKPEQTSP